MRRTIEQLAALVREHRAECDECQEGVSCSLGESYRSELRLRMAKEGIQWRLTNS